MRLNRVDGHPGEIREILVVLARRYAFRELAYLIWRRGERIRAPAAGCRAGATALRVRAAPARSRRRGVRQPRCGVRRQHGHRNRRTRPRRGRARSPGRTRAAVPDAPVAPRPAGRRARVALPRVPPGSHRCALAAPRDIVTGSGRAHTERVRAIARVAAGARTRRQPGGAAARPCVLRDRGVAGVTWTIAHVPIRRRTSRPPGGRCTPPTSRGRAGRPTWTGNTRACRTPSAYARPRVPRHARS